MPAKEQQALEADVARARIAEEALAGAEQKQYDDETKHGSQGDKAETQAQYDWAVKTATALGQPAPVKPDILVTKDECRDCQAEAERIRKLAAAEAALKPVEDDIRKNLRDQQALREETLKRPAKAVADARAAVEAAQTAVDNANNPKAQAKAAKQKTTADRNLQTAESKLREAETKADDKVKPLKAKLEKLEERVGPLQQERDRYLTPIECPNQYHCAPDDGKSSFAQPSESGTETVSSNEPWCPETAMTFPGTPLTESFTVAFTVPFTSDGGKFCTYDDARTVSAPVYFADDGGGIIPPDPTDIPKTPQPTNVTERVPTPTGTPQTPQTPKTPETPTTPRDTPKTPTDPPDSPKTPTAPPETPPVTTIDAPPVTTTDTPTDIPDTVFVKATEAVLEGQPRSSARAADQSGSCARRRLTGNLDSP